MSDSLRPQELQHIQLPCPSLAPGVCSNSYPLSQWCHPTILSSVTFFCPCPQSFPSSVSSAVNRFFAIRWPKNWSFSFSSLAGFIPLVVTASEFQIQDCRLAFFMVQLSHPTLTYMITGQTIALTTGTFVGKVMSLLFNTLSRFVKSFLPRIKHLLISWLQSPSAVTLEPKKIKSIIVSTFSPSICHKVMGPDATICFLNVEF